MAPAPRSSRSQPRTRCSATSGPGSPSGTRRRTPRSTPPGPARAWGRRPIQLANHIAPASLTNGGMPVDPVVLATSGPLRAVGLAQPARERSREQWAVPVAQAVEEIRLRWAHVPGSSAADIAERTPVPPRPVDDVGATEWERSRLRQGVPPPAGRAAGRAARLAAGAALPVEDLEALRTDAYAVLTRRVGSGSQTPPPRTSTSGAG